MPVPPGPVPAGMIGERDEDEIDLRELLDVLRSGLGLILAIAAVVTAAGLLYALTEPPSYTAEGLVQVEKEKGSLSASLNELSSLIGAAPAETEAELALIKSRMVLGKVAETLKLPIVAEPHFFPVIGEAIARARADLAEPAPAVLGLQSFAWGGERITVSALELPDALLDVGLTLVAGADGAFTVLDEDGETMLTGRAGQAAEAQVPAYGAVRIFVQELRARPGTEFHVLRLSPQSLFASIGERLAVSEQGKESGIIQISYQDQRPARAAAVVNEIQNVYLLQNVERRSEEAEQSLEFLRAQLPQVKAKVDEAQAHLNSYQMQQGTADVQKETELVLDQAVQLETARLTLDQERQGALQRFTAQHPVVLALDEQLRGIETELGKLKGQVERLPEKQQEIFGLMRDLQVNSELYVALLNSMQELQVAKAGTVGDVRIVDPALVPREPSKPNKKLIVLASAMLGLFAGVAAVFLRRALLRGVDRPEEVERALGLATYASIPYSPQQKKLDERARRGAASGAAILASVDGADTAVEALRSLRTSLHFALLEARNNVIMLTSPIPGVGKSFVSVNLAALLAQAGKKAVVVDADLRRGLIHKPLGVAASPGVSDFVAGDLGLDQVLRSTPVDGMNFVPKGATPPNPGEVLLHERFKQLVSELSARFDHVFIDTPPVLPVADAATVGQLCGSTLLVLKAAEHPMRSIEETYRRLRNAGVDVRGVIFNQVGHKAGSYGYGHYGYTYGYGGYSYRAAGAAR